MITSIVTEKGFDKIQNPSVAKTKTKTKNTKKTGNRMELPQLDKGYL